MLDHDFTLNSAYVNFTICKLNCELKSLGYSKINVVNLKEASLSNYATFLIGFIISYKLLLKKKKKCKNAVFPM